MGSLSMKFPNLPSHNPLPSPHPFSTQTPTTKSLSKNCYNRIVFKLMQYNNSSHPILPPSCKNTQTYAYMSIEINNLQIFQMSPKPVQWRINMWGLQSTTKMDIKEKSVYQIKTPSTILKQYLLDSKISSIIIYDTRNNSQIGTGIINWQLFVAPPTSPRSKQKQSQCPFYANQFDIQLPITNNRKKKSAEISVTIIFNPYIEKKRASMLSDLENPLQEFENRVIGNTEQLPGFAGKSLQPINQIKKKSSIIENKTDDPIIDAPIIDIKKKPSKLQQPRRSQEEKSSQMKHGQHDYQVQLSLLKMKTKGLISNTHNNNNQEDSIIIIKTFNPSKPHYNIEYVDISRYSSKKELIQNIRAYPLNNGDYNAEIRVRNGERIQLQIPNSKSTKGQMIFQNGDAGVKIIGMYNEKNQKVGYFSAGIIANPTLLQPSPIKNKPKIPILPSNQSPDDSFDKYTKQAQKQKIPNQTPPVLKNQVETFLLVTINNIKHYYLAKCRVYIKDCEFGWPYPSFNILSHSQLRNQMGLEIRDEKNCTVSSTLISTYKGIEVNPSVLDCLVVCDEQIHMDDAKIQIQICVGTMKQVNYHLHKIKISTPQPQKTHLPTKKSHQKPDRNSVSKQQKSSSYNQSLSKGNSVVDIEKFNKQRKHRTQMNRLQTQQVSDYGKNIKDQQQDSQDEDQLFLVEILSRFLHEIRKNDIEGLRRQENREMFQNMVSQLLENKEEQELTDIIVDMFYDGQKVEYEEFLKCCRSYQNFLELWWRLRIDSLKGVVEMHENWESNIDKYSQLGVIKRDILWKKALPNVKAQTRQNIQKLYKIHFETPVNTALLINDLKQATTNAQKLPQNLTHEIISDLGKLIRETIENNINGELQFSQPIQEKVNIKIMCDLFMTLGISLSYWEALMVIEELKAWYNIDYQLGQGILSSATVIVWINSLINRRKSSNHSRSQFSRTQLSENKSGGIMSQAQKLIEAVNSRPTHQQFQKNTSNKYHQNKSAIRSQVNQDQILNIANLLRDHDNYIMHTISSEQKHAMQLQMETNNKILGDGVLNTEINYSDLSMKKQPVFIHVKVKGLKLNKQPDQPIKLQMKLLNTNSHYFYIRDLQSPQQNQKQFYEKLDDNWHRETNSLQIEIKKSESQIILCYGALPSEEIKEIRSQKTKTIMLYENARVVGKIIIQVKVVKEKPKIYYADKDHDVWLEVGSDGEGKGEKFGVEIVSEELELVQKYRKEGIQVGEKVKILLPCNYYRYNCKLCFEDGNILIPLQQLYLRQYLNGQYPILSDDGRYLKSLTISLTNQQNILTQAVNNNITTMHQLERSPIPPRTKQTQYMIIIDSICTIDEKRVEGQSSQQIFNGGFMIKDAITRNIIGEFETELEHTIDNVFNLTLMEQLDKKNYCVVSITQKTSVTIEYEANGRPITRAVQTFVLSPQQTNITHVYPLNYGGNQDLRIVLGLRILKIPSTFFKYRFNRIFDTMSLLNQHISLSSEQYRDNRLSPPTIQKLKEIKKLTVTETKLVQEMITLNQVNACFHSHMLNRFLGNEQIRQNLAIELIINDPARSGCVSFGKLSQILVDVVKKYKQRVLMENIEKIRNGEEIVEGRNIDVDLEGQIGMILHDMYQKETDKQCCYWNILVGLLPICPPIPHPNKPPSSALKQVSQICEKITKKYQRQLS